MKLNTIFISSFILLCTLTANAQQGHFPFGDEIQAFKSRDSIQPPPQHAILFVGSSSFRKWTEMQADFPGYTIINRGFGGSTLPDVIHYANNVIFPYHPKQIVIYCGDNDVASSDTITAEMVLHRFERLFYLIRKRLPGTDIAFVSIKPSPSRQRMMPVMDSANAAIKSFLKRRPHTAFIDVYHLMLDSTGVPRKDLFVEDMLHMNAKGYAIWQKAIRPYLLK